MKQYFWLAALLLVTSHVGHSLPRSVASSSANGRGEEATINADADLNVDVVISSDETTNKAPAAWDDGDRDGEEANSADDDNAEDAEVFSVDLEELSPRENNCRLEPQSSTNASANESTLPVLVCARLPRFCRDVCNTLGRMDIDQGTVSSSSSNSRLPRSLGAYSFGSYRLKRNMVINFYSSMARRMRRAIDADALNGLVVESGVHLALNFYTSKHDERDDDDDDYTRSFDHDDEEGFVVHSNALRGLVVQSGGRLSIRVTDMPSGRVRVERDAFATAGARLLPSAQLTLSVERVRSVLVESGGGGGGGVVAEASASVHQDISMSVNVSQVHSARFASGAFADVHLAERSSLALNVERVADVVAFESGAFARVRQAADSTLSVRVSGVSRLQLGEELFDSLEQAERASLLLSVRTESRGSSSGVCVRSRTFANVSQAASASIVARFETESDVTLAANAVQDMRQAGAGAVWRLETVGAGRLLVAANAIVNVSQAGDNCSLELAAREARGPFVLAASAFSRIEQTRGAKIRIAFSRLVHILLIQYVDPFLSMLQVVFNRQLKYKQNRIELTRSISLSHF